jgi:hypothetical protein
MPELWAGVDVGKEHHHCVVIDVDGRRLLSRRVGNDQAQLAQLLSEARALAVGGDVTWAVDLNTGGAALSITLLTNAGRRLLYLTGRQVNRASGMYKGEGKTDLLTEPLSIVAAQRLDRHRVPMSLREVRGLAMAELQC